MRGNAYLESVNDTVGSQAVVQKWLLMHFRFISGRAKAALSLKASDQKGNIILLPPKVQHCLGSDRQLMQ